MHLPFQYARTARKCQQEQQLRDIYARTSEELSKHYDPVMQLIGKLALFSPEDLILSRPYGKLALEGITNWTKAHYPHPNIGSEDTSEIIEPEVFGLRRHMTIYQSPGALRLTAFCIEKGQPLRSEFKVSYDRQQGGQIHQMLDEDEPGTTSEIEPPKRFRKMIEGIEQGVLLPISTIDQLTQSNVASWAESY